MFLKVDFKREIEIAISACALERTYNIYFYLLMDCRSHIPF
jgi:hypothetical protein